MRPTVSKARGTKMCVVAISTYLSSLREAERSAALPAVILKLTQISICYNVSATVTSRTRFLPTCQELKSSNLDGCHQYEKDGLTLSQRQSWL